MYNKVDSWTVSAVVIMEINKIMGIAMSISSTEPLRRGYTVKYFFQTISWNALVSLYKLPRNVHDILFETFSGFSLSWKTLLLNLFRCLINPFVINGVYKSLKENVSITWKACKVVFVFWEAVVQRCSVKKVLRKETLAQMFSCEFCEISKNTFFIEQLWWLLLYFILQNLKDNEDRLEYFFSKLWMKVILTILIQLKISSVSSTEEV